MDNIIQFPRKYSGEENLLPTSEEEVNSKIDLLKYHHIHETLATVIPIQLANMMATIANRGYYFNLIS